VVTDPLWRNPVKFSLDVDVARTRKVQTNVERGVLLPIDHSGRPAFRNPVIIGSI
jgi:hypothetical protein